MSKSWPWAIRVACGFGTMLLLLNPQARPPKTRVMLSPQQFPEESSLFNILLLL